MEWPDAPTAALATPLPEVTITVTRQPQTAFEAGASVGVVTAAQARDALPNQPADWLSRVPGVVALDRQEIASEDDHRSAAQAVAEEAGIPVVAVATLADLLDFASGNPELVGYRQPLEDYRSRYGSRPTR